MAKRVAVTEMRFEFVQPGEFADPYYALMLDGRRFGDIRVVNGQWQGYLTDTYRYSAGIFTAMAEEIDRLNADLETQRARFWGL